MVSQFSANLGLLALLAGLVAAPLPLAAQPCTANCRSDQVQFTPGDPLTVEVINRSTVAVNVEQVPLIGPQNLRPGQSARLGFNWGTSPNVAIRFWNPDQEPLRAYLFRPAERTLQIEIRDLPYQLGDRSIYIQNDGRVIIY
ncbi:MAG TPA: hypothetical protein V6D06_06855 [Trichocoleus sp.]